MIGLLFLGVFFSFTFVILVRCLFFVAIIEGQSMLPTFHAGEKVLVLRYWPLRWLPRNAVIVTYLNSESAVDPPIFAASKTTTTYVRAVVGRAAIKRVIGLPGETVQTTIPSRQNWLIPPNHYFVKSDGVGIDSNILGPISFSCFQGLVITRLSGGKTNDVD